MLAYSCYLSLIGVFDFPTHLYVVDRYAIEIYY